MGKKCSDLFPNGYLISVLNSGKTMTGQRYYFNNKTLICNYAPILSGDKVVEPLQYLKISPRLKI